MGAPGMLAAERLSLAVVALLLGSGITANACGPETLQETTVRRVVASNDIETDGGQRLRLAGVTLEQDALHGVLLSGQKLAIGILSNDVDRWSRSPAIVFLPTARGGWQLLQERLILNGAARAQPERGLGDCWPVIAAVERATETRQPPLRREAGRFDRVAGRVSRVGDGRSALFVWLGGPRDQQSFAVVQKQHLPMFLRAGVDVRALTGKTVVLRGTRGQRNAAAIAVVLPEQIEIIR